MPLGRSWLHEELTLPPLWVTSTGPQGNCTLLSVAFGLTPEAPEISRDSGHVGTGLVGLRCGTQCPAESQVDQDAEGLGGGGSPENLRR